MPLDEKMNVNERRKYLRRRSRRAESETPEPATSGVATWGLGQRRPEARSGTHLTGGPGLEVDRHHTDPRRRNRLRMSRRSGLRHGRGTV